MIAGCSFRYRLPVSLAGLFLILATQPRGNAAPEPPASSSPPPASAAPALDPEVTAILDRMAKAYTDLKSYAVTIHFSQAKGSGASTPTELSKTTVLFQRPDKLAVEMSVEGGSIRAVSDAAHFYVSSSVDKTHYLKLQPPPPDALLLGTAEVGHVNMGLLPYAFEGANPLGPLSKSLTSLSAGATGDVDGVPVDLLTGDINPAPGVIGKLFVAVGKDDHLLHRVTIKILKPESEVSTVVETHSEIRVNPSPEASAFRFSPPEGTTAITSLGPALFNPALAVGAAPPDFSAKDTSGYTVSPSRLKGKVVLLNFWAGWAEPCLQQVPTLVSVYKRYHRQGLEILSVSLDYEGGRQALLDTVKEKGMVWPQIFEGKGWEGTVPTLYGVQRIPFNVLIGRDGKIAAVNLDTSQIEPAVQKAL